ncbi:hypothetical protein Tco_0892357 [Tanacetum coccineum]|uniref:Uncharacterized protein n=1 Tax=Tanacetum coccineum TaxID=301880 RepID=A0ABQ5C5N4_9ASTR
MELVLEQPKIESTDVLAPTPLRSVPSVTVDPPITDATSIGSSEDADVAEVDFGLKRKRATVKIGACRATSDSSAPVTHAAQSPPQTGSQGLRCYAIDQTFIEEKMTEILLQKTTLGICPQAEAELEVLCNRTLPRKNGTSLSKGWMIFATKWRGCWRKQRRVTQAHYRDTTRSLYPSHVDQQILERRRSAVLWGMSVKGVPCVRVRQKRWRISWKEAADSACRTVNLRAEAECVTIKDSEHLGKSVEEAWGCGILNWQDSSKVVATKAY